MEDDTDEHQNSVTEELLQIFGDFAEYIDVFLFEIVTFLAVVNSFIALVYDILILCGYEGWKMGFIPAMPFILSLTLFVFGTKKRKNKRNNKAAFAATADNLMEDIDEFVGHENDPGSTIGIPSEASHVIIQITSDETNGDKTKGILPTSDVQDNVLLQVGGGAMKAMKTSEETTLNLGEAGFSVVESGQLQKTVLNTKDLVGENAMGQTTGKVKMGAQMLNATRKKGLGHARRRKPKSLLQIYRRLGRLILRVVCRRTPSPSDGRVSDNTANERKNKETPKGTSGKIARLFMLLHRLRKRRPKGNDATREDTNVDYKRVPSYENQPTEGQLEQSNEDKTSHESVICEDKKIMDGISCLNNKLENTNTNFMNKSENAAQVFLDSVLLENMRDSSTQTDNEVVREEGNNRSDGGGLYLEKEDSMHSVGSQHGTDCTATISNENSLSLTIKDRLESTIVLHSLPIDIDPGGKRGLEDNGHNKEPDKHSKTGEQMGPPPYSINLSEPSMNATEECTDLRDSESLTHGSVSKNKNPSYTSLEILASLDF